MEISFTQAVMDTPEEQYYAPTKSKLEIMAPRFAWLVLKAMGIILGLGLLMSEPGALVPAILLVVAMITYKTMMKETRN